MHIIKACSTVAYKSVFDTTFGHRYDIDSVTGGKSIKSSPRELTEVELKSLQVTGNR